MRRGYVIQADPANVNAAIGEIEKVLEGAGLDDDCVAVLDRKEGRLYVTTDERLTEQLLMLEHISGFDEDEFDGYKIAAASGVSGDGLERLLTSLFNPEASGARLQRVVEGGLLSFVVRNAPPETVEKAIEVAGVDYVMPNYKGRMAPGNIPGFG
jgi:hypothetical protein